MLLVILQALEKIEAPYEKTSKPDDTADMAKDKSDLEQNVSTRHGDVQDLEKDKIDRGQDRRCLRQERLQRSDDVAGQNDGQSSAGN